MKPSYLLQDDQEDFASRFLGVDYEDFVNLQIGFPDDDEGAEVECPEYEVPCYI